MAGAVELVVLDPAAANIAQPGQFFQIGVEAPHTLLPRPYSVAAIDPARGRLGFLFSVVGAGSAWLSSLEPGDTIVDGGNSNFRDSQRRYREAQQRELHFVDTGVSGGIWGLREGFCLMAGGDDEPVSRLEPIFSALAPEGGYAHVGASGAGHFVKMVHNGIEYGLMQAYGEGFEVMHASEFDLDLHEIAGIWRNGSVVRSWLLDLLHAAFEQDGSELEKIEGYVEDSGEGRWTVFEAINESVPAPAISAALYARFASRQDESFAAKVNAALRNQFGGHAVKAAE